MNLVLSGPIEDNLRNVVATLCRPRQIVRQHARAYRFEGADDTPSTRMQVADLCDAARVDHAYIEEGKRFSDFKLLAMDMDSTLITIECIDEIADFAGKKKEVAAITEAAMRGEITDFAESLRRRVALLAGVPISVLNRVYRERLHLSTGAEELVQAAKLHKMFSILVSGGFTYFTERLRGALSLDATCANSLEVHGAKLTGRLIEPILDANGKKQAVQAVSYELKCRPDQIIAIGDGANDIPMLKLSPDAIAYHAKAVTRAAVKHSINYGDLKTVLDYFP